MTTVVHLTSVHSPDDPRIFHKECRSLAAAGFDVHLVAPSPAPRPATVDGVTIHPVAPGSGRVRRMTSTLSDVVRMARSLPADLFHLHDPELLAAVPRLRRQAPVVYDVHEDYSTAMGARDWIPARLGTLAGRALGRLELLAARRCAIVIAEWYYAERFPDATLVRNLPLPPAPDRAPLDPIIGADLDEDRRWFLYTGNVTAERGALTQLRILTAAPDTGLVSVGRCSAATTEAIEAWLADRGVAPDRFRQIGGTGHVAKDVIDRVTLGFRWAAGLALFPRDPHYARKELTKFWEYRIAGLPMIVTDFPHWCDMFAGDPTVRLVDPDDDDALRRAIDGPLPRPDPSTVETFATEMTKLVALYERTLAA